MCTPCVPLLSAHASQATIADTNLSGTAFNFEQQGVPAVEVAVVTSKDGNTSKSTETLSPATMQLVGSSTSTNAATITFVNTFATLNVTFKLASNTRFLAATLAFAVNGSGSGGGRVTVETVRPFGMLTASSSACRFGGKPFVATNPSAGLFGATAAFLRCNSAGKGSKVGPPGVFFSLANPYATLAGSGPPPPPQPPSPPPTVGCNNLTFSPYGTRTTKWSCHSEASEQVLTSFSPVAFARALGVQLPAAFVATAQVRLEPPPHSFPCSGQHGGMVVGMASKPGTMGFGDGQFEGYSVTMSACAKWLTVARLDMGREHTMATVHVNNLVPGAWHALAIVSNGTTLQVSVNGTNVVNTTVSTRWMRFIGPRRI